MFKNLGGYRILYENLNYILEVRNPSSPIQVQCIFLHPGSVPSLESVVRLYLDSYVELNFFLICNNNIDLDKPPD